MRTFGLLVQAGNIVVSVACLFSNDIPRAVYHLLWVIVIDLTEIHFTLRNKP